MYEHKSQPLIPGGKFLWRLLTHGAYVFGLLAASIIVGALGFMIFEGHEPGNALVHAAHILSGFGLIALPSTIAGRIFVSLFGLYASLFFLAAFSVMFAPVIHRILHGLNLDTDSANDN